MSKELDEYQAFIDTLVERSPSVEARRLREKTTLDMPSEADLKIYERRGDMAGIAAYNRRVRYNRLLVELSEEQLQFVADLLQEERESAIHDVLVVLDDGKYRLSRQDTDLPFEPFGTECYFDYMARLNGEPWPEE